MLRKVDGAEILRRVEQHGVTLMCGAPGRVERRPRRRRGLGRRDPRPRPGADRRRRRAAAVEDDRPGRGRARLGVQPDLRPHRDLAAAHHQPAARECDDLEPEERAKKLSRAGVPALGTRLQTSEAGEVLAQGNIVLAGYWENPDASAEALDGGWFHTGDGGTIDDGGYLTISDRKKDVIITGGENVSSIEVEDAVFSHPAVAEVAVIGVPDDKWGEMVTALVVVAEGEQVTEAEIIAHCRGGSPATRSPSGSSSATSLPAPPPARSRSSSCASRSGRTPSARSTEAVTPRGGRLTPRGETRSTPCPFRPISLTVAPCRAPSCRAAQPLRGRAALEVGTWTAVPGARRCARSRTARDRQGRRSPSPSRSG